MKQQIRNFIEDNFFIHDEEAFEKLTDDNSLMDTGVIDSTGVLELVGWLEKTYSITVGDVDITPSNLDSINKIEVFVKKVKNEKN